MRDPLDDLSDLRGVDVSPLSAAEVRARGDRLRRRRTVLSVTGAAAAVAVIALVGGQLATGTSGGSPGPATTTTPPTTSGDDRTVAPDPAPEGSLADEFPLAVGLPERNDDGSPVEVTIKDVGDDLVLCGTTAWTARTAMDLAGTSYSAPEDYRARSLLLYPSLEEAEATMTTARDALAGCASEDTGGTEQVFTPVDDALGDESVIFDQRYRTGGAFDTGLTVYRLVRVGAAVLLTVDYAEANGSPETRESFHDTTQAAAQPVLDEMQIFGGTAPPAPTTEVPADFPLDFDQVAMEADGGEMTGPDATAPGVREVDLCGESVWTVGPQDRLASNATGPEYEDARELRTYASADEAVAQLAGIRSALAGCPEDTTPRGGVVVRTTFDEDTGYDDVTFSETSTGTLGGRLLQFVRVGSAILATSSTGEFGPEVPPETVRDQTDLTRLLTPEMCVFTLDGC